MTDLVATPTVAEQLAAARAAVKPNTQTGPQTQKSFIPANDEAAADALATRILEVYPDMKLNLAEIGKGGSNALGESTVLFSIVRAKTPIKPGAHVTAYRSGTVVWVGDLKIVE